MRKSVRNKLAIAGCFEDCFFHALTMASLSRKNLTRFPRNLVCHVVAAMIANSSCH